jgi:hypothetical protein
MMDSQPESQSPAMILLPKSSKHLRKPALQTILIVVSASALTLNKQSEKPILCFKLEQQLVRHAIFTHMTLKKCTTIWTFSPAFWPSLILPNNLPIYHLITFFMVVLNATLNLILIPIFGDNYET